MSLPDAMPTAAPSQGTVLIVDDTPSNLALLSDMLADAHYRVLVATDGLTAIDQTRYLKPDIILLDVMMPGLNGFDTCSRLKNNPETRNIPIVFMTGLNELDDLLRGFEEGAIDYIVKPIRPAEVLVRIEVHLAQNRNLRRAEHLLDQYRLAAVAVTACGHVTWISPAASEICLTIAPERTLETGDPLPAALLQPFLAWQRTADAASIAAAGLLISPSPCRQTNEYLLLLQAGQDSCGLNPEQLKAKLKITSREAEILMWIARGKTNKEIGQILNTSPRTVNKHLEHIFEKLGVSTRSAAVAQIYAY